MPWVPGQSGNPKGRPPKGKVLGEMLQKASLQTFEYTDDKGVVVKTKYANFITERVMEALTSGQVTFPPDEEGNARTITLDHRDWYQLINFYFQRTEGLAPKGKPLDEEGGPTAVTAEEMEQIAKDRWKTVAPILINLGDEEEEDEAQPESIVSG